ADSGVSPESSSGAGIPVGETPAGAGETPALPDKMRFHPQRWAKVYDHWMANIQDWCISRQLWWGHRIPVWNKKGIFYETDEVFLSLHYSDKTESSIVTLSVPHTREEIVYETVNWDNPRKRCDLIALTFSELGAAYLN